MLLRVSRALLRRRSRSFRWLFAGGISLAALGLRILLDPVLPAGFPFITFFPAVTLAALVGGLRPGIAAAVACGLAAWYGFIPPIHTMSLTPAALIAMMLFVLVTGTEILLIHVLRLAVNRAEAAEARAQAEARSRGLMFQELQHRISNNLGVISSLLSLQRRRIADEGARRALEDAAVRLSTVSRLNRLLHDPEVQETDFAAFLRAAAPEVIAAAGAQGRISLEVRGEPVMVGPDRAVPLGLVAAELLANAVEHGFPQEATGQITVTLRRTGETAVLEIGDTGCGLPPGFALDRATGLGLTVARQFASQLSGRLSMEAAPGGGTTSRLVFPVAVPVEAEDEAEPQALLQPV